MARMARMARIPSSGTYRIWGERGDVVGLVVQWKA